MARYQDPFRPRPGETFSKRQVDRAGETLREFYRWQPGTELRLRLSEVSSAFAAVTWWRSLHAQPLSKVATNLRYHVVRQHALVEGRGSVTQRLKRTVTIGDKLTREPTMDVTQMQDIGGVRACVPNLDQLHAVSSRLQKSWTIVRTRNYIADPKHHREIPEALVKELQIAYARIKDDLPGDSE